MRKATTDKRMLVCMEPLFHSARMTTAMDGALDRLLETLEFLAQVRSLDKEAHSELRVAQDSVPLNARVGLHHC